MYEGFARSYQASPASPDQWMFVRWMTQTSSRVAQMEEFYDRMHDKQWLPVPRWEAAEPFVDVTGNLHAPYPPRCAQHLIALRWACSWIRCCRWA